MSDKFKKPAMPLSKHLMTLGVMLIIIDLVIAPTAEFEFMDYDWPVVWVIKMIAFGMIVFGFVFGAVAAISARKAHIAKMNADAAADAAANAAAVSESQSEPSIAQPAAQAESSALFAVPEPRVMVVNEVAKPTVEFPTSAKA